MVKIKLLEAIQAKERRERRRVSLTEIAKETGMSRQTVSRMVNQPELDRIEVDTIDILCRYFDCTFYDLIEITEQIERAS